MRKTDFLCKIFDAKSTFFNKNFDFFSTKIYHPLKWPAAGKKKICVLNYALIIKEKN